MKDEKIIMAHGAGGRLSQQLQEEIILPELGNGLLLERHDGAVLPVSGRIALTTDSYVIKPLFFPGGSIGKLAVCGTVNDLAMSGARARYLTLGLILEEGLPLETLRRIVHDIRLAAEAAGVQIVTGDTKVVGHGAADGIFINTAGVGDIMPGADFSPRHIRPGMAVVLSGTVGDHAATVMAARHGLTLPEEIRSDCAPLAELTASMVRASDRIAIMRDPTRGGLAAVLNELAAQSGTGMLIDEDAVPVRDAVRGVCDILGFDPLYLANEGKLVAVVPESEVGAVLAAMHATEAGREAAVIGRVTGKAGTVAMRTALGAVRLVDMPQGELVPRIC